MSPEELAQTIARYRDKGIVVDTNLLLLYLVGQYDPLQIKKCNRTDAYSIEDFDLLRGLLAAFSVIVTTPNILTEVCNLSKKLPPAYFGELRKQVRILEEKYFPARHACDRTYFDRFGLTDTIIAELSRNQYLVLTADVELWGLLLSLGIDAINFNHLRSVTENQ